MQMRKLMVALLAIGVMVVAGCGSSSDSASTGDDSASTPADNSATAKGGCDDSDTLEIGAILPLTGTSAVIGKQYVQGLNMAIRDANAAGGALGHCLKLDMQDDKADPTTSTQVTRQIISQDGVKFIVGPNFSSPTLATVPLMNSAKVINMNASAAEPSIGDATKYPYTFRVNVDSTRAATAVLPILKQRGYKHIAILAVNNAFGQSMTDVLSKEAPAAGFDVVGTATFESGTADLTPQMSKLKSTKPDVLISASPAVPDSIAELKARAQLGWDVPVFGPLTIGDTEVVKALGPSGIKDVFAGPAFKALTYSGDSAEKAPASPAAKKFVQNFAKFTGAHGGVKVDVTNSAEAYDEAMMLQWAINGAKSTDPDKVKAYFEANHYRGVAVREYSYSAQRHDGNQNSDLAFVRIGTLSGSGVPEALGSDG